MTPASGNGTPRDPVAGAAALRIRGYAARDAGPLARLFTASVRTLAPACYDARQVDVWAPVEPDVGRWRERLAGLRVLVAEEDAAPVGFLGFAPDGHLDLLFVAPERARRGVARALLRAAEARLRRLGVRRAFTEASLVARPFFAAQGYAVTATETVRREGIGLVRFRMERALDG